jgi:CRISPR-associated protein Csb2
LAERLYQFGRGVDMACAWAELTDRAEWRKQLEAYTGTIHRPSGNGEGGQVLPCPTRGSLDSLQERYTAGLKRFEVAPVGRTLSQSFRQQPRPRFQPVAYDCPPFRRLFELREQSAEQRLYAWPLHRAYRLVQTIRDVARARLIAAFASREAEIDRWLAGRKPDGSNGGSPEQRVRMIPLPSIGHPHADHRMRRVLVEVPANCPIAARDIFWAFNALPFPDLSPAVWLSVGEDDAMLRHYGLNRPAQVWRTVTPAVLPEGAARRRIDPNSRVEQAKNASERAAEQRRACAAVVAALRHAGLQRRVIAIRVQREPFEGKGERAEAFAADSRFAKERLWHVEIQFNEPAGGPVVIGDGRFLGLGIMAAVRPTSCANAEGLERTAP